MACRKSTIGLVACLLAIVGPGRAPANDIAVSQIYGGGGNSGAVLKLDFIELVNRGGSPISVDGWSVQYASATASSWQVTELNGILQPATYYLVQLGGGGGGTVDLPLPDAIGTSNMSASSGKVALVANSTALQGACPPATEVEDMVGYGTANCFEGAGAASSGSNTLAIVRAEGGCVDSNDNAADFAAGSPAPHNSSNAMSCGDQATPTALPSDTPTVLPSEMATALPSETSTALPSETPTASPSETPTVIPSETATAMPSETPTVVPSDTPTALPSETATALPIATATPTAGAFPSATATPSQAPNPSPTGAVCGNGIAEPGEQCDDGNDVDGDLCPRGCSYRDSGSLAHGHHRRRLVRGDGCQLEWYVVDGDLTLDSFGFASQTQTCADQDPGCDFDGEAGRCRFLVIACVNNADASLPDCRPDGVSRAVVVHPPAPRRSMTLRDANRAAVEHALSHLIDPANPAAGAVTALPLGSAQRDFCSEPFALDVERRGQGNAAVNLIVDTFGGGGERSSRERARLRLVCTP